MASVRCVQDFAGLPDPPDFEVQALALADTINVGDTINAPAVQLLVAGRTTQTTWQASVVQGSDVIRFDSAFACNASGCAARLIVLKPGLATLRVRPVNSALPDTTVFRDVSLLAVVPALQVTASADTAYSIADEIQLTATARTRGGVVIPNVTATWEVVGGDTSFSIVAGNPANRRAVRNGDLTLRARVDTATATKTIRVRQRVTAITVTPQGATLTTAPQTFAAAAKDARGNDVIGAPITWSSLNTGVATVNAAGQVTPVASGQVPIGATSGNAVAYAIATVAIPNPAPVNLWAPMPSGTGSFLSAVWAGGASSAFAVGTGGTITRFDGQSWASTTSNLTSDLRGVSGWSPTGAVAAGLNGGITSFNGTAWSTGTAAAQFNAVWNASPIRSFIAGSHIFVGASTTWQQSRALSGEEVRALWGFSGSDIYSAGGDGTTGRIYRFDGQAWSSVSIANGPHLTGIWGTAANDLFAVGLGGRVLRFDGSQWTSSVPAGTGTGDLYAVWGTAPNDVYAVGALGKVIRYNGTTWSAINVGSTDNFQGVGGFGPHVFIVGPANTILRGYRGATVTVTPGNLTRTGLGLTQQYDGTVRDASNNVVTGVTVTWSSSNPSVASITPSGLLTTVADGMTNVCATATGGAQGCSTLTVAEDRVVASVLVSPAGATPAASPVTFSATAFNAVGAAIGGKTFTWASLNPGVATMHPGTGVATPVSSGQTIVSATADGVTGYAVLTAEFQVGPPVNLWMPMTSGTSAALRDVWGTSATNVFAVGDNGTALRYDGTSWTVMPTGSTQNLIAVWGTSPTNIYAVGAAGAILRFDGSTWSQQVSPTTLQLASIWGSAPNDIWVSGNGKTMLRFNGTSWTQAQMPGTGSGGIEAVWGHQRANIWARGAEHYHFDGTNWNDAGLTGQVASNVHDMWGSEPGHVWAVGAGGGIQRFATSWQVVPSGTTAHLNSVWGLTGSDVYAVGDGGVVLRYNGATWALMSSGTSSNFHGVWGTSNGTAGSDVFVVGVGGVIRRGVRGALMTMTPLTPVIAVGGTVQLSATVRDAGSNEIPNAPTPQWSSSDPSRATVSASGLVTGVAEGSASVCATAPGGVQVCTSVSVSNAAAVASVTTAPDGITISAGSSTSIVATARNSAGDALSGHSFTWATLHPAVATVNVSSGQVTGVAPGQAIIEARTTTGVAGYAVVTVTSTSIGPVTVWAPAPSLTTQALHDVWGTSSSNVFAGGDGGVLLRFDGSSWTSVQTGLGNTSISSVRGTSANEIFAASCAGSAARFNGSVWEPFPLVSLNGGCGKLWIASPRDIFLSGDGTGAIHRFNGNIWATSRPAGGAAFSGVWGASASSVHAVRNGPNNAFFSGTAWADKPSPGGLVNAVWGTSSSHAIAVGEVIQRWDGTNWVNAGGTFTGQMFGVHGTSPSDVLVVGQAGQTLRFDGTSWIATTSGVLEDLRAVWAAPDGYVFAVGAGAGRILRGYRNATVTAVNPSSTALTSIGQTRQFTAAANEAAGGPAGPIVIPNVTFTWTSGNPSVATVNAATGLVTAVSNGSASICATAPGGAQGCANVSVAQAVASIAVSPTGASINSGTEPFSAVAKDANGNTIPGRAFTWESLNTAVATIDPASGVATAVRSGQTTIRAAADGVFGYGLLTVALSNTNVPNVWVTMSSGVTTHLNGVWGTTESNVFVVGDNGVIRRFDGTSWTGMTSNTNATLNAIGGTSSTDLYATGYQGTLMRFDGTAWSGAGTMPFTAGFGIWAAAPNRVYVASDAGVATNASGSWALSLASAADHRAIWGSHPENVYVAIANQSQSIKRFDGTNWQSAGLPQGYFLTSIWGTSSTNVIAAGFTTNVLRFDGSSWIQTGGTGQHHFGVWGSGPNDVYVVGDGGNVIRYNGTTWNTLGSGVSENLRGIWGVDNSIFIVGNNGLIRRGYRNATVTVTPATPTLNALGATQQMTATAKDAGNATISGAAFPTWSSSDEGVATVSSLGVVTAVANGTTNVCATAVGGAQGCTLVTVTQQTASVLVSPISHFSVGGGTTFTATARDANGNTIAGKTFTWASLNPFIASINPASGVMSAVGSGQATMSASVDGVSGYALVTVSVAGNAVNLWAPVSAGTAEQLHKIWIYRANEAFAVGSGGARSFFNGTTWTTQTGGQHLNAVWGLSINEVYAVGQSGTIRRWNGSTWMDMASGTTETLNAVWGSSPRNIFAVGNNGTLLKYDGTSWNAMSSGTTANLYDVWGHDSTLVYVVGAAGTAFRLSGTDVIALNVPTAGDMRAIWGAFGTLFVGGTGGTVYRGVGSLNPTWSAAATGFAQDVTDLWGASPADVYATGFDGRVSRFNGASWTLSETGVTTHSRGVFGTMAGDVHVSLDDGRVLRGVRNATITVTPATPTLTALGATQQMSATARNQANDVVSEATFTWSSSDPAVATVSATGLLTAVADGTTSVCATAPGGAQGCTTVTVAALIHGDTFSGTLANWVEKDPGNQGSWAIQSGVLVGDYDIGCGSPNCHQSQLLLIDALQPGSGNWRLEFQSVFTLAHTTTYVNQVTVALWVSDTEKEGISVGQQWSGAAPPTATDVVAAHATYPWAEIARVTLNVAQWTTGNPQNIVLEKRGNQYTAYFNGVQVYQVTRTFTSPPKVGFSTYGQVKLDNAKLYRLP